ACLALRTPAAASCSRSVVVVQDRAGAAVLGEQRIAAEPEQVEVERLVGLLLAVALDFDGDGLGGLAGGKRQRAGLGEVVVVTSVGAANLLLTTNGAVPWRRTDHRRRAGPRRPANRCNHRRGALAACRDSASRP